MLFRLFTATRGSERISCCAPPTVDAMLRPFQIGVLIYLPSPKIKEIFFKPKKSDIDLDHNFCCYLYNFRDISSDNWTLDQDQTVFIDEKIHQNYSDLPWCLLFCASTNQVVFRSSATPFGNTYHTNGLMQCRADFE